MITNKKIIQYNTLLDSRFILDKEIEQISYVLLSIDLSKSAKSALLNDLDIKTQQYKCLVNQIGNFKFE